MSINGMIFDMDGTILDSMQMWGSVGLNYVKKSKNKIPCNLREILLPMNMKEMLDYIKKDFFPEKEQGDIYQELMQNVYYEYQNNIQLKKGAYEFLTKIKEKKIKMYLATATPRYCAEVSLKRLGIFSFFEGIITVDEIKVGKREPDIYYYAMEKLGTNSIDTMIFEDAYHAILTCYKANLRVCGVYDDSSKASLDMIKEKVEQFIYSFDEFLFE